MDKNKKGQSRRYNRPEGRKPNGHKDFPNYLIQRPALQKQEERDHPGTFNGKGPRSGVSDVPYLERRPDANRSSRPAADSGKPRIGQKESRPGKQEERTRTSSSLPVYAQHKSRRPFRPTRLPSTWRKREEVEEKEYDFPLLKKELRIAERDLILLDLNPPAEEERTGRRGRDGTALTSRKRPNRALHRSLGGIMEQERVQDKRKRDSLRLRRNKQQGYSHYFD